MAMNHSCGEDEMHRQQEIHAQRKAEQRSRRWAECRQIIDDAVRKLLRLLLIAAVALFVITHFTQIRSLLTKTTSQTVAHLQTTGQSSPLHQSAVNHEKELDKIVGH